MSNQVPSIGRIVHFVMGPRYCNAPGASRPAIITNVHNDSEVALSVFTDAGQDGASPVVYVKSSKNDEGEFDDEGTHRFKPDSWHWPPYVAQKIEGRSHTFEPSPVSDPTSRYAPPFSEEPKSE